jgi:hypothetical protein
MHYELVVIGGLVVACLPLDPSFAGSNPAEDDEIFLHVKDPCGVWQRYYVDQMQGHFLPTLFFITRCLYCNQRALVDEAGIIRTQMGTHNRSENGGSAREALYDTIPYVTSNIISSMFLLYSQHHLQVKLKFITFFPSSHVHVTNTQIRTFYCRENAARLWFNLLVVNSPMTNGSTCKWINFGHFETYRPEISHILIVLNTICFHTGKLLFPHIEPVSCKWSLIQKFLYHEYQITINSCPIGDISQSFIHSI